MIIIKIIFFFLLLYLVAVGLMYLYQEKLLFQPDLSKFEDCAPMTSLNATPVDTMGESYPLRFYLRQLQNPIGWLVFFHGNAGSACDRSYFLETLQKLPLNFVFYEYPGYAGDLNKPNQDLILKNSMELIEHIKRLNSNIPVVLFGESLGTGPATYVASNTKIQGLILQSPYPSIVDVAKSHYPFMPVEKLLIHTFPAKNWAPDVECPVLGLHGKRDDVIPYHLGNTQIRNFNPDNTQWISFENASHNDFTVMANHQYWKSITAFLTKVLAN